MKYLLSDSLGIKLYFDNEKEDTIFVNFADIQKAQFSIKKNKKTQGNISSEIEKMVQEWIKSNFQYLHAPLNNLNSLIDIENIDNELVNYGWNICI